MKKMLKAVSEPHGGGGCGEEQTEVLTKAAAKDGAPQRGVTDMVECVWGGFFNTPQFCEM